MSRTEAAAIRLDEIAPSIERRRLTIEGRVQGVGFRPFVHRLAHAFELTGWVANGPGGVVVEVQGEASAIASFQHDLWAKAPASARIDQH